VTNCNSFSTCYLKSSLKVACFLKGYSRIRNCLAMWNVFYNSELHHPLLSWDTVNLGSRARNFAVGQSNLADDQRIVKLLHSLGLLCYLCDSWNNQQTVYTHTVTWMFLEFCWGKGYLGTRSVFLQQRIRNCSAAWITNWIGVLFWGSYKGIDEDYSSWKCLFAWLWRFG